MKTYYVRGFNSPSSWDYADIDPFPKNYTDWAEPDYLTNFMAHNFLSMAVL